MAEVNPEITPELARERIAGTFPGELGVEFVEIGESAVVARLRVADKHLHPGGYAHGGVWTAFADTIAGWGTRSRLPTEQEFTTSELKLNVFAAARPGDELVGRGEPLHVGRRTQVWEVRIHVGERLGAVFTCTQMMLPSQ